MNPHNQTERFTAYNADTVEVAREMPDDSVDYSVFSPPFASLYTYSNSARDMGNVETTKSSSVTTASFKEQFRVMAPGRLVSIHCMTMPTTKERDGYIGLRDFRGDIIRAYQEAGFIYHSEVCIWKNPVTAMQRTHALGLLHKTVLDNSTMSRQGIPDYVVTMRKPGVATKKVTHWATNADGTIKGDRDSRKVPGHEVAAVREPGVDGYRPIGHAQRYRDARDEPDERHICPLQLGVIRRCLELWTAPDDIVWSPFMGIGSEGYVSLQMGRRFIGAELKDSYYKQAVKNLTEAATVKQHDLFGGAA